MRDLDKIDLDNWITGHYGEDAFERDREDNAVGPDEDGRYDLGEIGDDGPTPEHYGDSVEDVAQAAKQYNAQFLFFMDAMKRNGVL